MSYCKMIAAAAVLAAVSLPLAANAGNILSNPGFESGSLAPWTIGRDFGASEDWNVTNTVSHSGSFSATDVGNEELVQTFAPIPVSGITDVSFWAEHPDPSVTLLAYDLFYTDSTDNEFVVSTSGTSFNFFDIFTSLDAGKDLDGISVFGNSAGRTYVDDFTISTGSTTPEPSSLAFLVISGVTGTGFLARRRRSARKRA